ncbi:MAG: enoyl-CoA hydratase-related protein [Acidimicrobiales bacterium]|jgi:2-(1,2-epoxy-1,2-dihydrophenyl)acetyl-CoA isomerase|nr:enoyl-CoA hydratase-related protein [Acidimicrobiales bacterium]MDP7117026.1 enoyl-CoA hydratase-related protein [Acidimicrobiales bacterium]MDP7410343.1 enoyl-CoA hydratase-related protein [Acidimicrobiales bacterium]MEE1523141.1 enoyl-CoA hydratase-related protein [Acidimicrobiales bacterium]MEE1570516.1 enoyl-CoA hydratase-related protein [Acidimicrobiales bacterium]|tara:strand:+ start:45 stop:836 length:792 start_codon:yes stop_codon:yes gene_type:complete
MSDLLSHERDDQGVHTLTFRRPEVRNALHPRAFTDLIEACGGVATDPDARAMVLTGEGVAFSAGGDFEALQDLLDGNRDNAVAELRHANEGIKAIAGLPVPTVAAVNGDAFGGGAAVALSTDFRIMSDAARLGFVFSRLGLSGADTGATWWLNRLVGPARAMEIVTLGAVYSADEALAAGLVTEVAPAGSFDTAVNAFAERLASLAPLATRGNKAALDGIEQRSLAEHLDLEAEIQAEAICSEDFREGLEATRSKRTPSFRGN